MNMRHAGREGTSPTSSELKERKRGRSRDYEGSRCPDSARLVFVMNVFMKGGGWESKNHHDQLNPSGEETDLAVVLPSGVPPYRARPQSHPSVPL